MLPTFFVILIIMLVIALIWAKPVIIQWRRSCVQKQAFPSYWLSIIERNIPIYQHFPKPLKKRLQQHIQVFLTEKQFIGCGGLQITEEIKIIIATQACLLLLNERGNYYPHLYSILVYPHAFTKTETTSVEDFYVEESQVILSGESWGNGQLVLSWEDIERDTNNWQDGHNVILHEFAHQLDQSGGRAEGVPILESQSAYLSWARIFSQEYQQLLNQVEKGLKTIIHPYGATNPAEFFAVVTETFFEKPQQLKNQHFELYQELKCYYKLDPIEWT